MRREIQGALRANPFVPFIVVACDRTQYEVRYPENAMLTDSGFYIHLGGDETVRLALLHVTQVLIHHSDSTA